MDFYDLAPDQGVRRYVFLGGRNFPKNPLDIVY